MRFPHAIEILSPTGTDSYGNPSASFADPVRRSASAFIVQRSSMQNGAQASIPLALLPPDTEIAETDRVVFDGKTYAVIGDIVTAASPSRSVLKTATLQEVPGA